MKTKSWLLNRKAFLKGVGVSCTLPYLECMGQTTKTAQKPKRIAFAYFPNGVGMPPTSSEHYQDWNWFPQGEGTSYKLTKSLKPLEPY